jgi:1,4-alpha-glucan branching enzyme
MEYGGSGVCNTKAIKIDNEPWNEREFSAALTLPPLGITVFKIS